MSGEHCQLQRLSMGSRQRPLLVKGQMNGWITYCIYFHSKQKPNKLKIKKLIRGQHSIISVCFCHGATGAKYYEIMVSFWKKADVWRIRCNTNTIENIFINLFRKLCICHVTTASDITWYIENNIKYIEKPLVPGTGASCVRTFTRRPVLPMMWL